MTAITLPRILHSFVRAVVEVEVVVMVVVVVGPASVCSLLSTPTPIFEYYPDRIRRSSPTHHGGKNEIKQNKLGKLRSWSLRSPSLRNKVRGIVWSGISLFNGVILVFCFPPSHPFPHISPFPCPIWLARSLYNLITAKDAH